MPVPRGAGAKEETTLLQRVAAVLLCVLLCCAAAGALADGEGVVTQSSCSIVQSGEYYMVYCFAQVHNNSTDIICLETGSFDLHGGEQILATCEVSSLWPYFLNPGEDGYLFDIVAFEPDESGNPVVPAVTGIDYNIRYLTVNPEYGSYDISAVASIETDESGAMYVVCELTNMSDIPAYDPTVAFGLYTGEGSMIYADGMTLRDVGIPAGGTVLTRFMIDSVFVSQWQGYGVVPAEARVSASFRADDD